MPQPRTQNWSKKKGGAGISATVQKADESAIEEEEALFLPAVDLWLLTGREKLGLFEEGVILAALGTLPLRRFRGRGRRNSGDPWGKNCYALARLKEEVRIVKEEGERKNAGSRKYLPHLATGRNFEQSKLRPTIYPPGA